MVTPVLPWHASTDHCRRIMRVWRCNVPHPVVTPTTLRPFRRRLFCTDSIPLSGRSLRGFARSLELAQRLNPSMIIPHSVFRATVTGPLLCGLVALVGCGGPTGGADQLPTYDVTGKVTVDGKPLSTGALVMAPVDSKLPNSGGEIQKDGTVQFSTYQPKGGIPAGEYKASLMMSSMTMEPVPVVQRTTVTITEEMDGGEVEIKFQGTGRTRNSLIDPP